MANEKKGRKRAYHCDMYYFSKVCPSRGEQDTADIRYRNDVMLQPRALCKTLGVTEDGEICRHCVEHKRLFESPLVQWRYSGRNGRVTYATPFLAKNIKAETIRAYSKPAQLVEYLKQHPDLYGVNANTGELVNPKVMV